MKYFTAERYSKFQHPDDQGEGDWEKQLELYDERLNEIENKLPVSVKKFMDNVLIHDADFDEWASLENREKIQFVIRQRDWGDRKFICVMRFIATNVELVKHPGNGFNDEGRVCWLYDEWDYLGDFDGRDHFSLSFLLTDGREVNIIFTEFFFWYVPWTEITEA